MTPVMQTRFGYPEGNCIMACVASILELSLDDCPDLPGADEDYYVRLQKFVLGHGYLIVQVYLNDIDCRLAGYTIATVITEKPARKPDGELVLHAVVYLDGKLAHDPNPQKKKNHKEVGAFDVFIPIVQGDTR